MVDFEVNVITTGGYSDKRKCVSGMALELCIVNKNIPAVLLPSNLTHPLFVSEITALELKVNAREPGILSA